MILGVPGTRAHDTPCSAQVPDTTGIVGGTARDDPGRPPRPTDGQTAA
ncbi:hypothetical protein Cci01nite_10960 [Catellatospora citrea]|uniref:Uncharacterized protein n=1 Tax=Catellatospora citrea TaxID=53366 RepID=A0A8J3K3R2_9ACTN|nr:hypothetical protein Cci01nite_10960 [Catellatospora citrea]